VSQDVSPRGGPETPLLEMRGIQKSFVGVKVLHGVDLECRAGEVHAIVGENGAGKSTLMKVLAGAHAPDAGEVLLAGEVVSFRHAREAQEKGVSIIYQEFNLLPERTVAQNVFLGREPHRGPLVDRRKMEEDTAALLRTLDAEEHIRPGTRVGDLPVSQQQTVEIAKALSFDARVLVMDEPTAALSAAEADILFGRVRALRERGLAVIYISHRLREVFELADRITVLKDGRKVGTVAAGDVGPRELVRMMVGRDLDHYYPPRAEPEDVGAVRLRVRGASVGMLRDIDLEVRSGEVVGLAGLQGSGRTELARAIFGVEPFEAGEVELDGKPVRIRSPREAIRYRIGFVTEDRKAEGIVPVRSVRENGWLGLRGLGGRLRRSLGLGRAGKVEELSRAVELRARSLEQEVRYLSGGNQQKVVLTKWLALEPRVLIFDEPTRGVDVGAKAGIHDLIRRLAREGMAVLMISSELPEVIGMSDRVMVLRNGEVAGELPANSTEADIMLLATGEGGAAGQPEMARRGNP
jgi:ABC-type sugar transport system ATPase subunit